MKRTTSLAALVTVLLTSLLATMLAVSLAVSLTVLLGVSLWPSPASAEIADYAQDTWGVYDSVTSGTQSDRIDSEVMAIEQIGNTIYVGGKFTNVRPWTGGERHDQRFLAAFDATTGEWIPSFAPVLDGPVYSLQASPDGSRLFVGGEFRDVAGVANTKALVALNPATGAVDTSWKAQLKLDGVATVYTLDHDGTWLYVGGTFSAVGGAQGVPQIPASRVVKLSLADARPDTTWRPTVSGGAVWGIAVSPDRNTVYLAGYFSSVNAVGGTQGFVGVDNVTGGTIRSGRLPHNNASRPFYLDVVAVNDLVFVAGMEHITYVLNASNLSVKTRHSTGGTTNALFQRGGDYQDLEVVGNRVYASCHCRGDHFADGDIYRQTSYSRKDPIRFVAAYSATTGSYLPSVTFDLSGSSGSWAVHGAADGCLWIGGDITRAGRKDGSDQSRGGFVRHCDTTYTTDTERPSIPTQLSATASGGDVIVTWSASTDNVGVDHYEIFRTFGGQTQVAGTSSSTSFTDPGLPNGEYSYYVKAVDAAGNTSWRPGSQSVVVGQVADSERPSVPTGVSVEPGANAADVLLGWSASTDNVGVTGYEIHRSATENGATTFVATVAGLSYTDRPATAGTYWYYLKAVDQAGNQSWRTGKRSVTVGQASDTERPTPPKGLQGGQGANGEITLEWQASTDNVAVDRYVIIDDATGSVVATVTDLTATVTGLTSAQSYSFYVRAADAADNLSWRSNVVTITAP